MIKLHSTNAKRFVKKIIPLLRNAVTIEKYQMQNKRSRDCCIRYAKMNLVQNHLKYMYLIFKIHLISLIFMLKMLCPYPIVKVVSGTPVGLCLQEQKSHSWNEVPMCHHTNT